MRFQEARRINRPLGYRLYLQNHPDGRYAGAARDRLADLGLQRSRTAADLELLLERYPSSPQAIVARRRLPRVLARQALEIGDPAPSLAFLDRFPEIPQAPQVKQHLAGLLYRKLPDLQLELESFQQQYRGTRWARDASVRLERILAAELQRSPTRELLDLFKQRFPSSARLASLQAMVWSREQDVALAALDLEPLRGPIQAGQSATREVMEVLRWCDRSKLKCAALRRQTAAARPWRPSVSTGLLLRQTYDPDLQVAWEAMASLAWIDADRVGEHLIELLGSPRLSVVWAAADALDLWLGRKGAAARSRWLSRFDGRSVRQANADEVQRFAYVDLITRSLGVSVQRLERLIAGPRRSLAAAYLLIRSARRGGKAPAPRTSSRFIAAAQTRVSWLKDAFPAELHPESLAAAILAEREMFALQAVLREIGAAPGAAGSAVGRAGLAEIEQLASAALISWRASLARASKSFQASRTCELDQQAKQHELQRAEALRQIRSERPVGPSIAAAICRLTPHPACEAPAPRGAVNSPRARGR